MLVPFTCDEGTSAALGDATPLGDVLVRQGPARQQVSTQDASALGEDRVGFRKRRNARRRHHGEQCVGMQVRHIALQLSSGIEQFESLPDVVLRDTGDDDLTGGAVGRAGVDPGLDAVGAHASARRMGERGHGDSVFRGRLSRRGRLPHGTSSPDAALEVYFQRRCYRYTSRSVTEHWGHQCCVAVLLHRTGVVGSPQERPS